MKLIIVRGTAKPNLYQVSFGIDFDILINEWYFDMNIIPNHMMSEIDKIITKSVELKFCVLNLKHPLLVGEFNKEVEKNIFLASTYNTYKEKLREFFAIRLQHRSSEIKLYEFGRRLFV